MTIIEICNIALGRLGRKSNITSLTDNNTESKACNRTWDLNRQALLREFTWGFSRKIALLAQSAESVPGWSYVYAYPPDCLQAIRIFNNAGAEVRGEQEKWDVITIGNNVYLACNVQQAYLEYTADKTDPSTWSAHFIDCLAWRLAFELAMPLTGDQNLRNSCWQLYTTSAGIAKKTTAAEKNVDSYKEQRYINARR